jgi:hypothetical protein
MSTGALSEESPPSTPKTTSSLTSRPVRYYRYSVVTGMSGVFPEAASTSSTRRSRKIGTLLDQAEAAAGPARDALLRQAAARGCRAFNEAVPRDDLREAAAVLQEARQRGGGQMRQLLDKKGKFADLVAAECRLLVLIGVKPDLVELIGSEMWSVKLDDVPHFVEIAETLRKAVLRSADRPCRHRVARAEEEKGAGRRHGPRRTRHRWRQHRARCRLRAGRRRLGRAGGGARPAGPEPRSPVANDPRLRKRPLPRFSKSGITATP